MTYREEELHIDINNLNSVYYESKSIDQEKICRMQDREEKRKTLHY